MRNGGQTYNKQPDLIFYINPIERNDAREGKNGREKLRDAIG